MFIIYIDKIIIFSSLSYQYILDLSDRNVIRVKIERIIANIYCMSVIESVAVLSSLDGSLICELPKIL